MVSGTRRVMLVPTACVRRQRRGSRKEEISEEKKKKLEKEDTALEPLYINILRRGVILLFYIL